MMSYKIDVQKITPGVTVFSLVGELGGIFVILVYLIKRYTDFVNDRSLRMHIIRDVFRKFQDNNLNESDIGKSSLSKSQKNVSRYTNQSRIEEPTFKQYLGIYHIPDVFGCLKGR